MEYPEPESFVGPDLLCRLPKPRRIVKRGHPEEDVITSELSRLAADEYSEDFMCHMKQMEMKTLPDVSKIDKQSEIKWCMRPYLIEFLVNAHAYMNLSTETLFLTVNLVDRYCSKREVYKVHYQLVGCAALLIACKHGNKTYGTPKIGLLEKFCCNFYPRKFFIEMEMHLLDSIDWIIGYPTVNFFLQLMVAKNGDDQEVEHMATYLCEIATYHREFISIKPSTMARLTLVLARVVLRRSEVDKADFDRVGSDSLSALSLCLHQPPTTLFNKYSGSELSEVSRKLDRIMSEQANRNAALGVAASYLEWKLGADVAALEEINIANN
ncbi:G1 S-specific cyclin [Fusarium albosuccineum]|uniref:G1 S-specific cyclin n=1 Tax=Fusarium albosuccineum TaxID=1237068 RepID=A0A8H4PCW3_9HYPO|nr:G1 S-specific cyclin [Fusarium albosuccineum]